MTDDTSKDATSEEMRLEPKRYTFFGDLMRRLLKEKPLGVIGLVIVILFLFLGIFADLSWLPMNLYTRSIPAFP